MNLALIVIVIMMFILGTLAYFHLNSGIPMCFGAAGFAYIVIFAINQLGIYDYVAFLKRDVLSWSDIVVFASSFVIPIALYVTIVSPLSKTYYKKKYGEDKLF